MRDLTSMGLKEDWRNANCVLKLPDPGGSRQLLTVIVISRLGEVYPGWLPDQLHRVGLPVAVGTQFVKATADLLGCHVKPNYPDAYVKPANLATLMKHDAAFRDLVSHLIEQVQHDSGE